MNGQDSHQREKGRHGAVSSSRIITMMTVYAVGFLVLFAAGSHSWDLWMQVPAFVALTVAGFFFAPEFFGLQRSQYRFGLTRRGHR